jgi:hypothetical protein
MLRRRITLMRPRFMKKKLLRLQLWEPEMIFLFFLRLKLLYVRLKWKSYLLFLIFANCTHGGPEPHRDIRLRLRDVYLQCSIPSCISRVETTIFVFAFSRKFTFVFTKISLRNFHPANNTFCSRVNFELFLTFF